jgi:hypothetical protein
MYLEGGGGEGKRKRRRRLIEHADIRQLLME